MQIGMIADPDLSELVPVIAYTVVDWIILGVPLITQVAERVKLVGRLGKEIQLVIVPDDGVMEVIAKFSVTV